MTRVLCGILTALSLLSPPLWAQSGGGWSLVVSLDGLRFGATARDTITEPAAAVTIRPSGRIGVRVGAHRALGAWAVGLTLGWAQGNVEAANHAVSIRDRTADLSRYRAGIDLERSVARLGNARLVLEMTPTLDLWALDGETRTRAGVEAGLTLRLPVAGAFVEHRLSAGVCASPLEAGDVGGEFELRALRTVGFGVGVRLPL